MNEEEKFIIWMKGYLSAIEDNGNVSKNQITELINRLENYLEIFNDDVEITEGLDENQDDDLPF